MAGEWRVARIEDVAEKVAMGPFGSSIKVETFVPAGIPVISGQHLHGSKVDDSLTFNFVTAEHAERLRNANVTSGDVIFTHAGNIGQVAYVPATSQFKRYVISQRQFYMRCDRSKVLPEYIVAYFKTPEGRHQLLANTSQTGVPSIAQPVTYLRMIEIPLPPLLEQRAIAHILGTLDDKIELNRRMNETLEAMARALFKSWFVDFDPVRAKAEGRDPGLPNPLADLFPDSFGDSELGEIPKGWKAGTLRDVSALNPEVWSKHTRPSQINYVDLSNTKWGRIDAIIPYQAVDAPSRAQRVLRRGDTIVGTVRPGNGSYAFVSDDGLTGSTGFAVLRPCTPQYEEFVYLAVTAVENIDALAHLADGGAYPAVRPETVAATPVVLPDEKVLKWFSLASDPFLGKMAHNDRQSRTLFALRDTLLPKLISGELRVKDAERLLGRTA
ncbi:MAG TPA: restriction endonuclease subunit S [Candidatus Polarisedimenticolia bacterium]|nr:restriction endonuclease subunit S [Candidatus Polarisedimenticolia bacterium]